MIFILNVLHHKAIAKLLVNEFRVHTLSYIGNFPSHPGNIHQLLSTTGYLNYMIFSSSPQAINWYSVFCEQVTLLESFHLIYYTAADNF